MDDSSSFMQGLLAKRRLTNNEVIWLAKAMDRGSSEARETLIEHNVRLVVAIARHYNVVPDDRDDLISAGIIGLHLAVDKFDWRKGVCFSTYATHWIKREIQSTYHNNSMIRVPENTRHDLKRLRLIMADLALGGKSPDAGDLAHALGVTEARVNTLLMLGRLGVISLDQKASGSDDASSLMEWLAGPSNSPETVAIARIQVDEAMARLRKHDPTAGIVIEMVFGLNGYDAEDNLAEIGRRVRLTRECIRLKLNQGLELLRQSMEDSDLIEVEVAAG